MASRQVSTKFQLEEIEKLEKSITALSKESEILSKNEKPFDSYPLSSNTKKGLRRGKFIKPTPIQNQAIVHGLQGKDILGAAKTGSGKTLAYLIPLLEDLYRFRVGRLDTLSAMIISPTRELALQIFEVLKVLSVAHVAFKIGTLIGGTDYNSERNFATRLQICVCTPGRILQHLEQTPQFDVQNLRFLVLDEADRLLDMGFSTQLKSILDYLPTPRLNGGTRQTLLFSATMPKSVKDLAMLSLSDPIYISVDETSDRATPSGLKQAYVECSLENKLDIVWSFIRTHLKQKTIIFFATCKQVRFIDAVFRKLRPGISLLALHGKIKPARRTFIYEEFTKKTECVLFATDIASRGLDFPDVDWVLQADCPDDVASYIHRVGRTARYKNGGSALLIVSEKEKAGFLPKLGDSKIPIKNLKINPDSSFSVKEKLRR